ncbi:MAG: hypothetical protein AAGA77_11735 [Bacteroidota bacterium]
MRKIVWLLFLLFTLSGNGQGYFESNKSIAEAYELVSTLRLDSAQIVINQIKESEPDNLLVYHIENYIDFFKIFINENEKEFKQLEKNKKRRLEKINEGDKDSPYYLFTKAEINLQWATARIKFDQKFDAAREVYRAYKLLEKNVKKFPEFIENKKSLSIIHALGESLPGLVRKIIGVKGSIELGTAEIKEVVDYSQKNDFLFKDESYAIYAYILFYQNNKREEAYQMLFDANLDHSKSPLICFLKANIAQKTGRNQEAIQILEERPKGDQYLAFPYLDFMYGKFKLYELDPGSQVHMLKFLEEFQGRHFIKEAYQKLAWYEIATNEDVAAYKKYMQLCLEEGHDLVDEDKQALKESKDKEIPNAVLLRARLLFDGGYFHRAYSLLIQKAYLFENEESRKNLEFKYRMGRLIQELKNYPDAIEYYVMAINEGENMKSFMACNAALQIGLIFEEQRKYNQAKKYFDLCLDISPKRYKNSLHQKAKSGKDRVKPFLN